MNNLYDEVLSRNIKTEIDELVLKDDNFKNYINKFVKMCIQKISYDLLLNIFQYIDINTLTKLTIGANYYIQNASLNSDYRVLEFILNNVKDDTSNYKIFLDLSIGNALYKMSFGDDRNKLYILLDHGADPNNVLKYIGTLRNYTDYEKEKIIKDSVEIYKADLFSLSDIANLNLIDLVIYRKCKNPLLYCLIQGYNDEYVAVYNNDIEKLKELLTKRNNVDYYNNCYVYKLPQLFIVALLYGSNQMVEFLMNDMHICTNIMSPEFLILNAVKVPSYDSNVLLKLRGY